jgi:hypothetical protein
MGDLTIASFAYLRTPLLMALVAFLIGIAGLVFLKSRRRILTLALMMVVFFHAARVAMIAFDPYLSSRPLADALLKAPPGELIVQGHFYPFSSVFFYAHAHALLLNGRKDNLEYGSNAPDAPHVFIDEKDLANLWEQPRRWYFVLDGGGLYKLHDLLSKHGYTVITESGGKYLLTNQR